MNDVCHEAIVRVLDPSAFVQQAYASRSDHFKRNTLVEEIAFDDDAVAYAAGGLVLISSKDRSNVEDVLLVDLEMEQSEADEFIARR